MEQVLQADIFFFVTTISVVIFSILFSIAFIYFIKMLKNFYEISENLKNGLNDASEEIKEMAEHVRESAIFTFIFGKRKKKGKQK